MFTGMDFYSAFYVGALCLVLVGSLTAGLVIFYRKVLFPRYIRTDAKLMNAGMRAAQLSTVSTYSAPYVITLESVAMNADGTYTWTWSVRNPAPGNGNGGTVQALRYWAIELNNCNGVTGPAPADVVSAAYSSDGRAWTSVALAVQQDVIVGRPGIQPGPVLKFDLGTSGAHKSFYRITVSRKFTVNNSATAYYRSGRRTGKGVICFPGMSCLKEESRGCGSTDDKYLKSGPK